MNRSAFSRPILAVLLLATLAILLTSVPSGFWGQGVLYGVLTAFAVAFGIQLNENEFGPVHAVGVLAFLASVPDAQATLIWAIWLGAVVGSVAVATRRNESLWRTATVVGARVTISYYLASLCYALVGGVSPLDAANVSEISPQLVAYTACYALLYGAFYILDLFVGGQPIERVLRTHWLTLTLVLVIPMPFAVLGAVVAVTLTGPWFTVVLLGLVLSIATQFSYSGAQKRLQRQVNELRGLSIFGHATGATLDTLLDNVERELVALLHAENCIVALKEPQADALKYPLIAMGTQRLDQPSVADRRLAEQVEAMAESLLLRHPRAIFQFTGSDPLPVRSWMGTPLKIGERQLGVLAISSNRGNQFSPQDLSVLEAMASNLSLALDNHALYSQQTFRTQQLSTLNTVSVLLSSTLALESVLDAVVSSASMLAEGAAVVIYMAADANIFRIVRDGGVSETFTNGPVQLLTPASLVEDTDELVLADPKPIVVERTADHDLPEGLQPRLDWEGIVTFIELPMVVQNRLLGVVGLYFREYRQFSTPSIEFLRTFANQSAQAIYNAQLYTRTDETLERRVEQVNALAHAGKMLTGTLDVPTIGVIVLNGAVDNTGAQRGIVVLREQTQVVASRNYPPGALDSVDLLGGIVGRVMSSKRSIRLDNIHDDPGDVMVMLESTRAQLCVPITQQGNVIGVIALESDDDAVFDDEDTVFVSQLANHAAIAIANVRLFRDIREGRDRLQVILDAMTEGIVMVASNGQIALANPAVRLIGLEPGNLIGRNFEVLLTDLDVCRRMGFSPDDTPVALINAETPSEAVSYIVESLDGKQRYVERQVVPIQSADNTVSGAVLVFYDQTQQRELDRTREDITRMIVHDLRSPLTAVTTSMRLLREVAPADSDFFPIVEKSTDASQRAIRKLLSRVNSLLDVAKMESGEIDLEMEIIDLGGVVTNVFLDMKPLAEERDVRLVNDVADNVLFLDGDGDKVERVIQNLVDNALKYTENETQIVVRTHDPGEAGAAPGFVRIDVSDQGPGIPDDYKVRLFDRFVQVKGRKGSRHGVGLGLTFCKLVTEAHGGRIWVEDNPTGGSVFAITLPVAEMNMLPGDELATEEEEG